MSTTPTNVDATYGDRSQQQQQPQQQQQIVREKYGKCRIGKLVSTAAIVVALLLVVGAIYMHVMQKHHLGRLNIELAENEGDDGEATLPFEVVTVPAMAAVGTPLLSDDCLKCIAATATANRLAMCHSKPCSIYRISKPYWQDAMRGATYIGPEDYEICVSNPYCAEETVRSFITSYAKDCDGDGMIRCRDHIMLHQLGPTGCMMGALPVLSQNRMTDCLRMNELE